MSGTYYLKLVKGMGFQEIGQIKSVRLSDGREISVNGSALLKENTLLTYGEIAAVSGGKKLNL